VLGLMQIITQRSKDAPLEPAEDMFACLSRFKVRCVGGARATKKRGLGVDARAPHSRGPRSWRL
jgi:hypothetical protein